jgi:hypothetical protein
MSAPLEDVTANNNAVFESASGSPAVAASAASPASAQNSIGASPLSNLNSEPLENSANSLNSAPLENSAPVAMEPPTTRAAIVPAAVVPSNVAQQSKRPRSQSQIEHDTRAKEFRARVNPGYVEMFKNIPQKLRPKGLPAWAARQAIELAEEEQNAFVKNVADERRNAIEVKLGKKTRRVNPSSLKDIESILKMSEQSLVSKYPSDKALIRMFGRETRRVARNYTSEHINTLVTPSRNVTRKATLNRLEMRPTRNSSLSEIELKSNSNVNRSRRRNVSPPAYNE